MITILPPIPPWLEREVEDGLRMAVFSPEVCRAAWGRYVARCWEDEMRWRSLL